MEIFICILLSIITIPILGILYQIYLVIKEKRNEIYIRNYNSIDGDFYNNIETTISFMSLCTNLIDNEIGKLLSTYIQTKNKYEYLKLDKDIEMISNNVYSAFRTNCIDNNNMIISTEYIMKYIIEETLNRLINITKEYNNSLIK